MTDPRFALVLEFIQRLRAGEALSVEDFQAEHPEAGPEIAPILREAAGWSQNGDTNTLQIRLEESGLFAGKGQVPSGFDTMIVQDPTPDVSFDKRYRKRRLLGEGGYGKVFLVEDTMHHAELLALKVIRKVHTAGEVDQRFRNEIRVLRALNHASIPMIFNDGTTSEGEIYYTMSYVQGRTLEQIIREEAPLDPERIHRFARQLLDVLVYAHDEGVVHRDLKPSNILVENPGTKEESVQVLDFGIAKVLRHEGLLEQAKTMMTEVPLGTPHYMAPEQVRGQGEDGRTDIYSLGTIIYQMCTGRLPFQGKTSMEILIARLEQTPSDLTSEEAPKWLRETIRRFLKRDREKRPDAREAQSLLAVARGEEKGHTPVGKLVLLGAILLAIPAVLFFAGTGPLDIFNQRRPAEPQVASLTAQPDGATQAPPTDAEPDSTESDSSEPSSKEVPPKPLLEEEQPSGSEPLEEEPSEPAASDTDALVSESTTPISDAVEASSQTQQPSRAVDVQPTPPAPVVPDSEIRVAQLNAQRELHTQENEPTILCDVDHLNQVGSMIALRGRDLSAGPDQRVKEGQVQMKMPLGATGAFDVALFDGKTWDGEDEAYAADPLSTFSVVIDRDAPRGEILAPGASLPPAEDSTPRYLIGENEITVHLQVEDRLPGRVSMPLAGLEGSEVLVVEPDGFALSDSPEQVTFDIPLQLIQDGEHRFEITSFDEAGNSSAQTCILVRDMTPPVITLVENAAIQREEQGSTIDAGTALHFLLQGVLTDVHPERLILLRSGKEEALTFTREEKTHRYLFETEIADLVIGANPMELVAYDKFGRASSEEIIVTRYPLPVERLNFTVESPGEAVVYETQLNAPVEKGPNALELPALEEETTRIILKAPRPEVSLSADGETWGEPGAPLQVDVRTGENSLFAQIVDGEGIVRRAYTLAVEVLPTRKPEGCFPVADGKVLRIAGAFYYERVTNNLRGVNMSFALVPPPASGTDAPAFSPFYLGLREVSGAEFTKALPPMPEDWMPPTDGSLPITLVLFSEAQAFCESIGADLPSAEQWAWAARGPQGYEFAWGSHWRRDGCNANERDEFDGLAPGGSFPLDRSWCGIFDLTGNATEWCRNADNRPKCAGGSYLRGRDVCSFSRPLGSSSKRRDNLGFRAMMIVD